MIDDQYKILFKIGSEISSKVNKNHVWIIRKFSEQNVTLIRKSDQTKFNITKKELYEEFE